MVQAGSSEQACVYQCSEHYYFHFVPGSPVAKRLSACKAAPVLPAPEPPLKHPPLPTSTCDGAPHAASFLVHVLLVIPTDMGLRRHRCGIQAAGAGSC